MTEEAGETETMATKIQESIRRRFPLGQKMKYQVLAREMMDRFGSSMAVSNAIHVLVLRGALEMLHGRDLLKRVK